MIWKEGMNNYRIIHSGKMMSMDILGRNKKYYPAGLLRQYIDRI